MITFEKEADSMKYETINQEPEINPGLIWITHGETGPKYLSPEAKKSFARKVLEIYGEGLKTALEILRAPLKS
jgi:hypothetical protein